MSIASNRLKLLFILALFLLPLLAAVLMYQGRLPSMSSATVNQGTLIQPPVAMGWAAAETVTSLDIDEVLSGSWVILLALPATCDSDCLQKVEGLRQVHKATGREQQRLELVLLTEALPDQPLKQQILNIYEQFELVADPTGQLHEALQTAQKQNALSAEVLVTYLVDPLGNIMMAYDTTDSETRMSKDLKRLLTWSKQDKG